MHSNSFIIRCSFFTSSSLVNFINQFLLGKIQQFQKKLVLSMLHTLWIVWTKMFTHCFMIDLVVWARSSIAKKTTRHLLYKRETSTITTHPSYVCVCVYVNSYICVNRAVTCVLCVFNKNHAMSKVHFALVWLAFVFSFQNNWAPICDTIQFHRFTHADLLNKMWNTHYYYIKKRHTQKQQPRRSSKKKWRHLNSANNLWCFHIIAEFWQTKNVTCQTSNNN